MNRSIRRKSKKIASDKEQNIKKDAKGARNSMINSEINKIMAYSENGFVDRKCLEELVKRQQNLTSILMVDSPLSLVVTKQQQHQY